LRTYNEARGAVKPVRPVRSRAGLPLASWIFNTALYSWRLDDVGGRQMRTFQLAVAALATFTTTVPRVVAQQGDQPEVAAAALAHVRDRLPPRAILDLRASSARFLKVWPGATTDWIRDEAIKSGLPVGDGEQFQRCTARACELVGGVALVSLVPARIHPNGTAEVSVLWLYEGSTYDAGFYGKAVEIEMQKLDGRWVVSKERTESYTISKGVLKGNRARPAS
jgi:hypothetical protein